MDHRSWDLTELRAMWEQRRQIVREAKRNIDTTGMTRPRRDPDERAFLEEREMLGPFVETDNPPRSPTCRTRPPALPAPRFPKPGVTG